VRLAQRDENEAERVTELIVKKLMDHIRSLQRPTTGATN